MIGICGFLRLDGASAGRALLAPMQQALVRCGSPSQTSHQEGPMAFGAAGWHASLAVDAAPAMYRHAGSGCVVVADARLQGRSSLARDMGMQLLPETSDAELIAQAWLRHGHDCAARLDGDFAFAVWDPRTRSISVARDIVGTRPLHLHHAPGRLFAFASSTPALLALAGVPNLLNEARIGDFLVPGLEGIDQRVTFHQHVERLPPAHQCTLSSGHLREHRYWRLGTNLLPGMPRSDAAWADALHGTLEAVIADHLGASQTTGCMLSGGLDSSSLAVVAADQLRRSGRPALPTFSSVDTHSDNHETRAILAVLELPGFQPHFVERVTTGDMADRLWQRMWDTEEPFDGTMLVLNAQYLSAADAGVGAVLDGVEGDMLFLPGNGQARLLRQGRVLEAWRNAQGLASLINADVPGWRYFQAAARIALIPDALRRWRRSRRPRARPNLPAGALISMDLAARIDVLGRLERMQAFESPMPHWNRFADARETMEQPYLTVALERYRRVAAAQGVNAAHPLLDRRLQTLCSQLPDHLRLGAGQSKHLLRRIMRGRLPEPVRVRGDKQHLGWLHSQALLEAHRAELGERLAAHRATVTRFVDAPRIASMEQALADPTHAPKPEEWQAMFNLAHLGSWLERQVKPKST